ncbi:MAG: SDR family oxidoreductase [Actinomyces sp.]|nr:MAG: SDR family oxidoreductase [Actinomyces sp.]
MGRFEGKVALITGAASGMGRAICRRLADEGAAVMGLDIDAGGLDETVALVTDAGGTMRGRRTDISLVAECDAAVAECVDAHGRLDILGNVAGLSWARRMQDETEEGWDAMFGVNVKGMFFLTRAALPHLVAAGGSIVNIASNAGLMGQAYCVPYCASKGAVVNMTRAMAMELIKTPVRVNAIAPGGTRTPMTENFELPDDVDFDLMRPYMGFREMGTPEQIAALFAFVASDEAANIHGSILSADSGLTCG